MDLVWSDFLTKANFLLVIESFVVNTLKTELANHITSVVFKTLVQSAIK